MDSELTADSTMTHACTKLIYLTYFLHNTHYNLPALMNTRQHFRTVLGGILNSKTTSRKHKNVKHMALSRSRKGQPFTVSADTMAECHLIGPQSTRANETNHFASLRMSANDPATVP